MSRPDDKLFVSDEDAINQPHMIAISANSALHMYRAG